MRPIDADALIEDFENSGWQNLSWVAKQNAITVGEQSMTTWHINETRPMILCSALLVLLMDFIITT